MKGVVNLQLLGRFGNCCFSYCAARAYAEKHDCAFRTDPWDGECIFDIQHERIAEAYPPKNEYDLVDGEVNFTYRSYSQQQKCMIYTRKQACEWLKFRPEIEAALSEALPQDDLLAHRRVGDFIGYGYPVVSEKSYYDACARFGLDSSKLRFITEESPTIAPGPWPAFLPDFYRMTRAKTLLRGNSCFSWWAATLCQGRVFSPVIDGLTGGREHDMEIVEGNHPRLADLSFVTELRLDP